MSCECPRAAGNPSGQQPKFLPWRRQKEMRRLHSKQKSARVALYVSPRAQARKLSCSLHGDVKVISVHKGFSYDP